MIIITGKDSVPGTKDNDSPHLNEYFELGWEVVLTHLITKFWTLKGRISRKDTIVTCPYREFLYSTCFDKVITWNNLKLTGWPLLDGPIIDFPATIQNTNWIQQVSHIKSCLTPEERKWITESFMPDYSATRTKDRDPGGSYACMLIRKRAHCAERDLPEDYLLELIEQAKKRYNHIYVLGKNVEHYCTDNMTHVVLQQFTTLVNHPNCQRVFGPLSGGMAVNCLFGKAPTTFIDAWGERDKPDHPLMFGECVNLAGIHMNHIQLTRDWSKVFEG